MGLWIDSDMGVDDLMAILMMADHGAVDGLSLVFGCASLPVVRANALAFETAYGLGLPLFQGAGRALNDSCETCERILGPTGQPSRGRHFPPAPDRDLPEALPALTDWLSDQDNATILALGPLTNIAVLLRNRPALGARIGRIVWMGGSVGRGNHTADAEFNAYADPEALDIVLRAGVPLTMVDLEACRKVVFGPEDLGLMPAVGVMADLVAGYLDIGLSRGRPGMALYDPVAAALLIHPSFFETVPAALDVSLNDPARRGQTRKVGADGPCQILGDLQAAQIRAAILSAMRDPA